jgi:hypothetical protein
MQPNWSNVSEYGMATRAKGLLVPHCLCKVSAGKTIIFSDSFPNHRNSEYKYGPQITTPLNISSRLSSLTWFIQTENDKMVDTDNHYDTEPQMVRAESNVSEHLGHKEYQEKDYMEEAASYDKDHDDEEENSPIEEVAAVVPKYELCQTKPEAKHIYQITDASFTF